MASNDEDPPPFFSTKKALHLCLESPLTHYECSGMVIALERASGPSGKPSTLTRQSLVLGFLICLSLDYRPFQT